MQAVDDGFQLSGLPLREEGVGVQVDRNADAAEGIGAQAGAGIGIQGEVPVFGSPAQALQAQGDGIGGQTSGNHEGVNGQLGLGQEQVLSLQLAVQGEPAHAEHPVQGVCRIGENDERTVCTCALRNAHGRGRG